MNKIAKTSLGIAGLAVIGVVAIAGPANAATSGKSIGDVIAQNQFVADNNFVPAITPGGKGFAEATWRNRTTTGNVTGFTLSATAPAGTSFDPAGVVGYQYNNANNSGITSKWNYHGSIPMSGCTLTASNTVVSCKTNNNLTPGEMQMYRFSVNVAADAAPNALLRSTASLTLGTTTVPALFTVKTFVEPSTEKPAAPVFTIVDNSSGTTVVHGTGVVGATVNVTNPAGDIIGTGTVDADGNFAVTLDKDYSGTADDLTITQTVDGLESDPTTIDAAALPVVNPAVALGTGIAALLAAGGYVLRRKRRIA